MSRFEKSNARFSRNCEFERGSKNSGAKIVQGISEPFIHSSGEIQFAAIFDPRHNFEIPLDKVCPNKAAEFCVYSTMCG